MTLDRMKLSAQTVRDNIAIMEECEEPDDAGYYLQLEHEKFVLECIEKQIPKKATAETINRGIDISGEYDIDFNLCCPVCGGVVGTFEGEVDEYFSKYCPNCGQALDWSDTE